MIDNILNIVAETTGVDKENIQSKNKEGTVMFARHLFHYLARIYGKYTLTDISKITKRTHATVINSIKIIEDYKVMYDWKKNIIAKAENKVKQLVDKK